MTRIILVASSTLLAVVGLACLFLPELLARWLALASGAADALPLAAAALIGVAALNWTGRGAIYGGIYGRPIVLANFMTVGVTTLVLLRGQLEAPTVLGWTLAAAFLSYLAGFALLLFRPPTRS